jgi:hypothetical protein
MVLARRFYVEVKTRTQVPQEHKINKLHFLWDGHLARPRERAGGDAHPTRVLHFIKFTFLSKLLNRKISPLLKIRCIIGAVTGQ